MSESAQCTAYRGNDRTCANGFIQKPFCRGRIGCFSCGAISERSIPHCLKDELPERWIDATGKPFPENGKNFPPATAHSADCDWHTDQYPWECTCGAVAVSRPHQSTPEK